VNELTINGGELNVSASAPSDRLDMCMGINASRVVINDGTIAIKSDGIILSSLSITLPSSYTYWTNTVKIDPGGKGTTYPGGDPFVFDDKLLASYRYVKIQTVTAFQGISTV